MKTTKELKTTKHKYKGFDIIGSSYQTAPRPVLGGRHWSSGGTYRTYQVMKDGKYVLHPSAIMERLKDAKEWIDEYLEEQK